MKKVVAICSSTRASSTNLDYIHAVATLAADKFDVSLFPKLIDIPPFNPDEDGDNPPPVIAAFRQTLRNANGILICTPEYAMGVPGVLKNAIDWTVSSMEFSSKPTALITASLSGEKGHRSLMETLRVIEAAINPETELVIFFAKTKITRDGTITDPATLAAVKQLINAFAETMEQVSTEMRQY